MSLLRPARSAARPATLPAGADAEALRARRLLLGLYVLLGLTVSSWLARLPTVRTSLDLTTGDLGTVLLVGALGSLVTVLVAGAFVARFGSRATLLTAAVVFSVANVLLGLAPTVGSVPLLVLGVLLMSSSFALGNVPMNVQTVVIERRMGRTIVPQFHAGFSVGSVLGSALGAAASWGHVPLLVQFGFVSVLTLVWRVLAVPGAVLETPAPVAAVEHHDAPTVRRGVALRSALGAWRERRTLLIGVVVMAAALSEGSANNWLAIAVVDGFEQPEAVAAVVFGVFVAAMTASRLLGTWAIDRFGRVAVLLASGVASLVGLASFGLAPNLPLAVLGVVAWGLGAGLVVPIGMAAVSADPLRAAGRVAVVSAFASVASIAAPPLIGLVAEVTGTRHALLLILVVMVAGTALSRTVREEGAADRPAPVPAPAPAPAPSAAALAPTLTVPGPRGGLDDTIRPVATLERVGPTRVGPSHELLPSEVLR